MNEKQIEIVRSTVPLLEERGVELTRYFYKRMLKGDSQVEKFFNPSHLHNGGQQEALAGAICAYAKHIDNPRTPINNFFILDIINLHSGVSYHYLIPVWQNLEGL